MKKVLLRGPLLTASGYGEHSRQFFRWLETREDIELKVQCLNWGITTWYIDTDIEEGLIGRIMKKTNVEQNEKFDISIQVQLPNEWDPSLANYNVGVSAFMETNKCSYDWFLACEKMDKIIAPSEHSLKSVLVYGNPNCDTHVINEPYNPLIKNPDFSFKMDLKTDFNFLMVSQLTDVSSDRDRKNILNTISAFCETFKDDKNVGLIVKTNLGRSTMKDRKITQDLLSDIIKKERKSNFPKVYLVHGLLSPNEMSAIYNHKSVKGLISLTRGEGYGLPLLEASVSSLPVIATNWSGHLDFLTDFVKIKYNIINIPDSKADGRMFQKGMKWADPDIEDFKLKIKDFKENYKTYKKSAKKLASINSGKFSQKSFNNVMNEIIR